MNTINNVPRELLEEVMLAAQRMPVRGPSIRAKLHALLSAPSPAGVGGLEVVGWYRMDDRKAITPYPSVCATWHKMGVKVGAAYSDSAQAIIDGLRGEVAKISSDRSACWAEFKVMTRACLDAEKERDQLAGLLRESEKTISQLQAERPTSRRIARYLDAMRAKINAALADLPK